MTLLESTEYNQTQLPFDEETLDLGAKNKFECLLPVNVESVHIHDDYETRPGREQVEHAIAVMDEMLADHADWQAPRLDSTTRSLIARNPVSEMLYEESATLQEWYVDASQARATALYPLQRPDAAVLASGGAIDDRARTFFYHVLDARGIRSRARVMNEIIARRHIDQSDVRWTSLACGAAVPVVETLRSLRREHTVHVDLIDMDEPALRFASNLIAEECGLIEADGPHTAGPRSFTTHKRNLVRTMIAGDALVNELGEGCSNVVDAIGIFEYFSHRDSVSFLRNAYRLVRDDGVLVFANMLADRPLMEFMQRGIGWPHLYPRSLDELCAIISEADIEASNVHIILPTDGVYAVIEIVK